MWSVPLVRGLEGLEFTAAVTFLVGEGMGAVAWDDLEPVRVTRAFMADPAAVLTTVLSV